MGFKESLYSLAGVQWGIIEPKPRTQAWKSNSPLYKYSQLPHASDTGRNISCILYAVASRLQACFLQQVQMKSAELIHSGWKNKILHQ